jgi:integrase
MQVKKHIKRPIKFEDGTPWGLHVPPGKKFTQAYDIDTPGLLVRRYASGRCVAACRYEVDGIERFKVLLDVVRGTKWLATARQSYVTVRSKANLRQDIVQEEREARAKRKAQGQTIKVLLPEFLAANKEKWRKSYYDTVELHLTEHLKGVASTPVKAVTRQDIVEELDEVESERGPVAADRAKSSISTFFSWAIDKGYADGTPVIKIKARGTTGGRDRVLTPGELREVWRALDDVHLDYRRVVRLLILTAQRRNEIGLLPWTEVNLAEKRLELPGGAGDQGRTKNHRAHLVPLSPLALAQLPNAHDPADPMARSMMFGLRLHSGFSGWGKCKQDLDDAIAKRRRKRGIKEDMPHFVLHDLRRTAVTLMGENKIAPPHVIEAIVNHISGHKAGVAGIYQRATYWDERVQALDDWAAYVERLVV